MADQQEYRVGDRFRVEDVDGVFEYPLDDMILVSKLFLYPWWTSRCRLLREGSIRQALVASDPSRHSLRG